MEHKLALKIEKEKDQLEKLQPEIDKALAGDRVLTPDDLATLIKSVRKRLSDDRGTA